MASQIAGKTRADLTIIETAIIFIIYFFEEQCLNIWQL